MYNTLLNSNRKTYPLRLAYVLAIHKSQGQTLNKVVIDLGKTRLLLFHA